MFLWNADFEKDEDKSIDYTLYNAEGKEYSSYKWIDIDKLNNYNIVPRDIIKLLQKNKFSIHKIIKD